jgi:putative ABC transport system ATP-binding protein
MQNKMKRGTRTLVRINDLTRYYWEGGRRREVLSALDLELRAGERVALLGRSGSGKSTLLNLISGIDRPSSGQIIIDGLEVTNLSERERTLFRRQNIGFVYQFFNLIPTLTVGENLLLPLELNQQPARVAQQKITALLEEVGLADRRDSFPDRLSGGEQQRVAIARALVHDPMLVLADEPTGNLDVPTGRSVLGLMDRLLGDMRKGLIVVTHSRQVSEMADRILLLKDGRIAEQTERSEW